MNTWFTSDYHLNHGNIIRYCRRPFKDIQQMNKAIIDNHNNRVKEDDTVFFLGDFIFRNSPGGKKGEGLPEKADYFINKLNGRIVFIKGNHDRNNSLKTNIERVILGYGGHRICMVHNPVHADDSYALNFVGHVHEKWKFKKLSNRSDMINVGVDVWNFRPISFDEIMKGYKKWKRDNEKEIGDTKTISKRKEKKVRPEKMGKQMAKGRPNTNKNTCECREGKIEYNEQ